LRDLWTKLSKNDLIETHARDIYLTIFPAAVSCNSIIITITRIILIIIVIMGNNNNNNNDNNNSNLSTLA